MLPTTEIQRRLYYWIYRLRQEEQQVRQEIVVEGRARGIRKKVLHLEKETIYEEDKIVLDIQRDMDSLKRSKTEFGHRIFEAVETQMKGLSEKDKVWHEIIEKERRIEQIEEDKININKEILKDIDTQLSSLNIAYITSQKPDFVSNKARLDVYIRSVKLSAKRQDMKKSAIEKKNRINKHLVEYSRDLKELRARLVEMIRKEAEISSRIEKAEEQITARLAA